MSGDPRAQGPAAPVELTDDEVEELAGDRTKRPAAAARLARPTEAIGRLDTASPVPISLSAKDLEAVQRAGHLSPEFVSRLPASDVPAEAPKKAAGPPVNGPKKLPR